MTDSDEQLVYQCQKHASESAMSELAIRYLPQFYRTARAMMLTHAQSEDIAQEVMLKIIRSIGSFRSGSGFRAWSYTILLNTIRTEVRRDKRMSTSMETGAGMNWIAAPNSQPESNSIQHESQSRIDLAISKLTDNQRTALVLHHLEGLSAAEVASIEGCSVDAVYQRVADAKRKLRSDVSLRTLWLDQSK